MINDKSKKILEEAYAAKFNEVVEYIVFHDEQAKARELFGKLEKAVSDNLEGLKLNIKLWDFYKEAILKLKFICLPTLEDKDVISLIKNNFSLQWRLPEYDLMAKFDAKISNIIVFDDRDSFKNNARQALLENEEKISPNNEIKTIRDWLKNYVSKVGLEGEDKLARAQYLVTIKNNKTIGSQEYYNLSSLFKFFDQLNIPADSPQGLSEEPPIIIDGKLNIFRKGILEPVPDNKAVEEAMELFGEKNEDKTENKTENKDNKANNESEDNFRPNIDLNELEEITGNYRPGSLEYKAIQQEIKRLKATGSKKPDVKK